MSSTNLAIKAAKDLTEALRNPHPAAPFLPPHTKHIQVLKHLATIFGEMANPKAHHAPPLRVRVTTQKRQTLETSHFVNAVYDPITGNNLEYRQLIRHPTLQKTWLTSSANEFGRLAQGIRDIPGTYNIQFIHRQQVPPGRKVT